MQSWYHVHCMLYGVHQSSTPTCCLCSLVMALDVRHAVLFLVSLLMQFPARAVLCCAVLCCAVLCRGACDKVYRAMRKCLLKSSIQTQLLTLNVSSRAQGSQSQGSFTAAASSRCSMPGAGHKASVQGTRLISAGHLHSRRAAALGWLLGISGQAPSATQPHSSCSSMLNAGCLRQACSARQPPSSCSSMLGSLQQASQLHSTQSSSSARA
jgi:hypothetical protein